MIPQAIVAEVRRIETGKFRASDLKTLLINIREKAPRNSALRELGDIVAHPEKTKGMSFRHIVHLFGALNAFLQHQDLPKIQYLEGKKCEWWLKPYLTHQITMMPDELFKEKMNLSKVQIENKLREYFPHREKEPTQLLKEADPFLLYVARLCASYLHAKAIFHREEIEGPLLQILESMGVKITSEIRINRILAGLCAVLHGLKIKISDGIEIVCTISIQEKEGEFQVQSHYPAEAFAKSNIPIPPIFMISIFDSGVSSKGYFAERFWMESKKGNGPHILQTTIDFDTANTPIITPLR